MMRNRFQAFALAGALVGWSFTAGIDHPWRRHPVSRAALGTALAAVARVPLGLRGEHRRAGLRHGAGAAVVVATAVGASEALPRVREAMAQRDTPERPGRWLALEIPLGTGWSEETAFRAALAGVAATALGPARGRLVQAAAFGLSHIPDARAAGESAAATVAATAAAGWVFGLLRDRSGSLLAPVLAHLAINQAGALAVLAVQRRARNPR